MPWKMVTRHCTNMTLKEAVEEIKASEQERKLVSKFEAKHRDEIDKILGLIDYIDKWYVEKSFPEIYDLGCKRLSICFKDKLALEEYSSGYMINRGYSQLDYFKKTFGAFRGLDKCAFKYIKKVKELIDKPLDEIELGHIRLAMKKITCPCKLDISVFYQLTKRLPHEDLNYDDER